MPCCIFAWLLRYLSPLDVPESGTEGSPVFESSGYMRRKYSKGNSVWEYCFHTLVGWKEPPASLFVGLFACFWLMIILRILHKHSSCIFTTIPIFSHSSTHKENNSDNNLNELGSESIPSLALRCRSSSWLHLHCSCIEETVLRFLTHGNYELINAW